MTMPWGLVALLGLATAIVLLAVVARLAQRLRRPPRRTAGWALARGRPADPGDLGLAWREDAVAGMPFWIAANSEEVLASPSAPTVVLLHGWGRSRRDMLGRLEPWRRRRYRMVMPDLRGHGDADGPSGLGTPEVGDVMALVDALPPGDVLLCGHSMGGVVAIHTAARLGAGSTARPTPFISGVVALAPYERVRIPAAAQLAAAGFGVRHLMTPLLAVLRICGVTESSTTRSASDLQTPLLVLHGEDDQLCPIGDAHLIAAAAGRHGRFEGLPNTGHDDLRPESLEGIERRIEHWLDELPSGQQQT
jgi:pimeloyl-ACP methyl ester carboxylesterase